MSNHPDVAIGVAAAEIAAMLSEHVGEMLMPGSVEAHKGGDADKALLNTASVIAGDTRIVISALVRGGQMVALDEYLRKLFNIIGSTRSGDAELYAAIVPLTVRGPDLPETFCIIVRPA